LAGLVTAILPLLVFTKTGGTSPVTIDWSQIPVGIPVEKTLLRWIGFDVGMIYALG
jgi:hypothetical protein